MKKLLVIMCLSVVGCGFSDYTIHPSTSSADRVYVVSNTGRNPAYSMVDVVSAAVKFCDGRGGEPLFITDYRAKTDVKFMCVKHG